MENLKELVEMKKRRITIQKEECERVKENILKALKNKMTSSELAKASIIYKREEDDLLELRTELKILDGLLTKY